MARKSTEKGRNVPNQKKPAFKPGKRKTTMVVVMKNGMVLLAVFALFALLLAGCASPSNNGNNSNSSGLANPASVNCVNQGGKLRIVEGNGGQTGLCDLPNGITCEEWAYFRGECPKPGANSSNGTNATNGSGGMLTREAQAQKNARDYLTTQAPTFVFDGMLDSVKLVDNGTHREPMMGRPCQVGQECWQACYPNACWTFTYAFDSRQAGYGNRSDMMLAQVITPHKTETWVDPVKMSVVYAITDGKFDELTQNPILSAEDYCAKSGGQWTGSGCVLSASGMTEEYCNAGRGHWNGNACLCGGIAGWMCPNGYGCEDMKPSPSTPDAMGACKPLSS